MIYTLKKNKNHPNFIDIELKYKSNSDKVILQIPAWRPGRYELQNFAKNIPKIEAFDKNGQNLGIQKITKDAWEITCKKQEILVKYSYYAHKTDAGSSFVDSDYLYINFVNCLAYIENGINKPVSVEIEMPKNWQYACALEGKMLENNQLKIVASSFYTLYDSPFIAAKSIATQEYFVEETQFQIQIIGNYQPNWNKILPDFEAFSRYQICKMVSFPVKKYQFLVWILPTAFYHGVEHSASTMIVLGPDNEGDSLITDLLGVSSHELFHAWNICKIRPKQLLPYDFSQENYFDTGFVVEGVTTYFGDLFLLHAKVILKDEYLKELSTTCIRHFVKDGQAQQSIVDSSIDLWIDGYTEGIPQKKVSIYHKGALVALLLDLMIRNKFDHKKSLYCVMKAMWDNFGMKNIGYTLTDYKLIAETIFEAPLNDYFNNFIAGNVPIEAALNTELKHIGLGLVWKNNFTIVISEIKKPTKVQKMNLEKFLTDNYFASI